MNLLKRLRRLANPAHLARAVAVRSGEMPSATLREDLFGLVVRGVHAECERFRFVQVGGYDGVTNDYLREFLLSHQVEGFIVEPQMAACEALEKLYAARPDIHIHRGAVSDQIGELELYKVAEAYRTAPDGSKVPHSIASLDPQHPYRYMQKHAAWLPRGLKMTDLLATETVPTHDLRSLFTLLRIDALELLFVDAEGFDANIVTQALEFCRPRIINFEHKGLQRVARRDVWRRLEASGYRLMAHRGDYGDTLAVREPVPTPAER